MSMARAHGGAAPRPLLPAERREAEIRPARPWEKPHAPPRWSLVRRVLLILAVVLLALLLMGAIAFL